MMLCRFLQVIVALATLAAPLAAVAQASSGSVTTAPFSAAPAMGMPLLALLVVILAGGGAYFLRSAARGTIAKVGFVAALAALAGVGYATAPAYVTIEGAQCGMQAVQPFDPTVENTLVNHCPNRIKIISIRVLCVTRDDILPAPNFGLGPCDAGQVLANGDACTLPTCTLG